MGQHGGVIYIQHQCDACNCSYFTDVPPLLSYLLFILQSLESRKQQSTVLVKHFTSMKNGGSIFRQEKYVYYFDDTRMTIAWEILQDTLVLGVWVYESRITQIKCTRGNFSCCVVGPWRDVAGMISIKKINRCKIKCQTY